MGLLGLHKYLPYRTWFRQELFCDCEGAYFGCRSERCAPYWNRAALQKLPDLHKDGRRNLTQEINAVLTLEAVERLLIRPVRTSRRPSLAG